MKSSVNTVEDYVSSCPAEVQERLRKIFEIVRSKIPDVIETISYKIPAFTIRGRKLYVGVFRNHIGLYPPVRSARLQAELAEYQGPKGNLRFPLDQPIPYGLIGEIVEAYTEAD